MKYFIFFGIRHKNTFLLSGPHRYKETVITYRWFMQKNKRSLILRLLMIPAVLLLILSVRFYADNKEFTDFTQEMFRSEITGNTLNLHYTLSNPKAFDIENYPITLGSADPETFAQGIATLENYRAALSQMSYKNLSKPNRLTFDILSSYLDVQEEGKDFALYAEPLGPSIGTQAQLPVLLAEYTFRNLEDVKEYLTLLSQMDTYYASLLEFEKEKSDAGLFMSDRSADHIISQCQAFIHADENFLLPIFEEKIEALECLSADQKTTLAAKHEAIVKNHVLPAYQLLINGLTSLKGTGKNAGGLANFEHGKEYYEYLVKDSTGCYDSIADVEKRIQEQLLSDFRKLQALISEHPEALNLAAASSLSVSDPSSILKDLQKKIAKDFPSPPAVSCDVKYVHKSLEDFLSPAFYLTPPVDNLSSNVIYINNISGYSPLELYTTLAHEGYPGHLYQTVFSGSVPSNQVRNVLNFGGYVEGWATYVEMYAYSLADVDAAVSELYRLNRSITLGISSALDIAVHYHGFTREQVTDYLSKVGFQSGSAADSLYDMLIEAPANYLKYYVGYLNFIDLRDAVKEKEGEDFTLKEFHKKVLEIGPAPFSVLKKYLLPEDSR